MSVFLATAFDEKSCANISNVFDALGISAQGLPKENQMTMHDLCTRMRSNYKKKNQFELVSPKKVGRAWQIQASDIIINNADRTPWYAATSNALPLLGFWKDFEPEIQFILVYISPKYAIINFDNQKTDETLKQYMVKWREFHSAMLHYYSNNKDTCTLINLERLMETPDMFEEILSNKFGLNYSFTTPPQLEPFHHTAMDEMIAASFTIDHHEHASLFTELENMADLAGPHAKNTPLDIETAWSELTHLKQNNQNLLEQKLLLSDELSQAKSENELLFFQLGQVQEELELSLKNSEISNDKYNEILKEAKVAQVKLAEAKLAEGEIQEIKNENDLLTLQLQQVQEELERVFYEKQIKIVDKSPPVNNTNTTVSDNRSIDLDLRHFIDGRNWHEAEHDGRWTGPGTVSSLNLDTLAAGKYAVTVDIVSGMSRQILDTARLRFNEKEIVCKALLRRDIRGPLATMVRAQVRINSNARPYPAQLIGTIVISEDQKSQKNRLEIVLSETISPLTQGESDTRKLGLRISKISFNQL